MCPVTSDEIRNEEALGHEIDSPSQSGGRRAAREATDVQSKYYHRTQGCLPATASVGKLGRVYEYSSA